MRASDKTAGDNAGIQGRSDIPFTGLVVGAFPSVRNAHSDQGRQDFVPGPGLLHDPIGKHATVPADMAENPSWPAIVVTHPKPRVPDDVERAASVTEGLGHLNSNGSARLKVSVHRGDLSRRVGRLSNNIRARDNRWNDATIGPALCLKGRCNGGTATAIIHIPQAPLQRRRTRRRGIEHMVPLM